jgi:hypothetical protein
VRERGVDRLAHDAHRIDREEHLAEEQGDRPSDQGVEEAVGDELARLRVDRGHEGG